MPSNVQPFGPDDKNTTIWSPGSEQNPDGCANVYSSLFVEGYFYKKCPSGFSSNQLYLTLPAGFVSSTVSQEEATQFARELLAAKGAEIAEAQGTCTLGEFQEIFSTVDATFNWDWVADKAEIFPKEFKNVLPNSFNYGTGTEIGIIMGVVVNNSLTWPLMVGFFYSDTTLFLNETANEVVPSEALRVDIHDDYGLMHMDFKSFQHDTHPNLTIYAGRASNENADFPLSSRYMVHHTSLYLGKLVADFGSKEIYGPPWDEDTDGQRFLDDNPFGSREPNPDYMPEFTVASLGGFLFRIDTASRGITNGKLSGVYLVCYKEDVQVYKYDAGADDYVSVGTIPYNPKNTTTYFGASILFNGTNKFLEIYIDGQFELSIADDTLTNIHLPVCYQRGVFSMDHWVGDIVSGVTYPGTNRLPPPITTRYFEPTTILNPDVPDPAQPGKKFLWPAELVGADTALEANKPFPKLAAGEPESGFKLDRTNFAGTVSTNWGGAFFGGTSNLLVNFDLNVYPEIGEIPWGSHALSVGKTEMNRYSLDTDIPNNPYKILLVASQLYPIIPNEDIPGIDWATYGLFDLFWENFDQHPRWSCSWDAILQPSDLFTSSPNEGNNATVFGTPNDVEIPVFQAGLYTPSPNQVGDGWLYTSSMHTLAPGRIFSNSNNGEFVDILTKDDIINHHFFFGHGWFSSQIITDLFTAVRTVKFMTGVQGKRTSDPLEAPKYNFNYVCPAAPTLDPSIDPALKCVNKEFVFTAVFENMVGGTHFPSTILSVKDCLFGDPYDNVCYPSRNTWLAGFNFAPSMSVVFANGDGIVITLRPFAGELVYGGARILSKLHVEFPSLILNVYKEGWPGTLFSTELFIDLESEINNPPATSIGYSTAVEACYFIPTTGSVTYRENVIESKFIPLVEVGDRYKFVLTVAGLDGL